MKGKITSAANDQAQQRKNLGGMPPKKSVAEIMKVNTPSGRKPAPDSFRPRR
jgi:hypothetical protein